MAMPVHVAIVDMRRTAMEKRERMCKVKLS